MPTDDRTDSSELQTLFDSIAALTKDLQEEPEAAPPPVKEASAMSPLTSQTGEASDDELQSLFDTVYASQQQASSPSADSAKQEGGFEEDSPQDMFQQIGQMTRRLHSMLHELGYDDLLRKTASETIPDTRQRLEYITEMTEKAAQKVLAATEVASPLVETIGTESKTLQTRWDGVFQEQVPSEQFRQLALDTREFLSQTQERLDIARAQLMDIMMAQDFQDLTGQVIKKVISLAQDLESQLLFFLIDNIPSEKRSEAESLMNGPVINPTSRDDVVTDQIQVDNLLESLGF